MKQFAPTPGSVSDEAIVDLMLRTGGIGNAIIHGSSEVTLSEQFHRAMSFLVAHYREIAGSQLRHALIAYIAGDPLPKDICREADITSWSKQKQRHTLEQELKWTEENVDENSYSSLAYLADLYMRAGYNIEARIAYERAMKLAHVQGISVTE